jgi:uncharacterized protein
MNTSDSCILCFVKYPKKRQVKARLTTDLHETLVVELYKNFVHDTLETIKKIDADVYICFYPPQAQKQFLQWLGSTYEFIPQQGENLGQRMKNSFIEAFHQGYRRVILMGSDSPDLPADILTKAFQDLQKLPVVIGPTTDGGYYLVGFQHDMFQPEVFDDIHWSSPTVYKETLKKIHTPISILPIWSDVDTFSDLKQLIQRNKNTAFTSSQTISFLQRNTMLVPKQHAKTRND